MRPLRALFEDAVPWDFYLILLASGIALGWLGYRAFKSVWETLGLSMRINSPENLVPMLAIKSFFSFFRCLQLAFVIFLTYVFCVMVEDKFLSFRLVEVSATNISISYQWNIWDRELRLADVQSIDLAHIRCLGASGYRLYIQTTSGKVFHSGTSYDDAVIENCRRIVEGFHTSHDRL